MAIGEKVVLRAKLINLPYKLVITDKNVYIYQNMTINRRNNKIIEDKLTSIQEIEDISLIDEGIKILKLHLLVLLAKEGCYLP